MKILYIAIHMSTDMPSKYGVYLKMRGQVAALNDLGHVCDLALVNGRLCEIIKNIGTKENEIISQTTAEACFGKNSDYLLSYDTVYIRGDAFLFLPFYSIIRRAKLKNCLTILEFPTYPITAEILSKAREKLASRRYLKFAKSILGIIALKIAILPFILHYTDICVAVSYEGYIGGKKAICIENGIDISRIPCKKNNEDKRWITLIAVANISLWHGYDRVIKGLANYKEAGMSDVRFHIIGEGSELGNLEKLVRELKLDSKIVRFLGYKFGDELTEAYNKADIGIGSLGLHRQKLKSASSLKSREYCARGIPMMLTEEVSHMEPIKEFIAYVTSSDDPIDIFAVKEFFEALPSNSEGTQCLRNYAVNNFTWKSQMAKVINGINNLRGGDYVKSS